MIVYSCVNHLSNKNVLWDICHGTPTKNRSFDECKTGSPDTTYQLLHDSFATLVLRVWLVRAKIYSILEALDVCWIVILSLECIGAIVCVTWF